jgi:cytosine/adenosine deaminase-related metal-dependent hydrolase
MTGDRTIEDKYLNGLLAAVEMIRKGCTACCDLFFEFPIPSLEGVTALGRAYQDAGMRAVIAPTRHDRRPPRAQRQIVPMIQEPELNEQARAVFQLWVEKPDKIPF